MSHEKPKLISKIPSGKDLFPSKAPEHIAELINDILEEGKMHIIGLDGAWGSGKSNILKIVERKWVESNGHFMLTYDVWGHMEESQRRAILRELVDFISTNKPEVKDSLEEQLKNLEGRKVETSIKSIPRLHAGLVLSTFIVFLMPLVNYFMDPAKHTFSDFASVMLLLSPLWAVLLVLSVHVVLDLKKDKKDKIRPKDVLSSIGSFLSVYNDKELDTNKIEYTSTDEASVADFHNFMRGISTALKDEKLIIVLDNIDRLPYSKIFECWSVINTFFPETVLDNIYVIVAFDRAQVQEAFSSELRNGPKDDRKIGDDYINKTFDMILRVAPPMISDWKNTFIAFWILAYGDSYDKSDLRKVERVFELTEMDITPRNMISFINEIVVMDLSRNDDVPLEYMAILAAKRNKISENPLPAILDHKYLEELAYLYEHDGELNKNIAALFYQVDSDKVFSVVYTSRLKIAFDRYEKDIIERIVKSDCFEEIIDSVIDGVNNVGNAVLSLAYVDEVRGFEDDSYWDAMYSRHSESINLEFPVLQDFVILLLQKISNGFARRFTSRIISSMYIQQSNPIDIKTTVDQLVAANINDIDIFSGLRAQEVNDQALFVKFLDIAGSDYDRYKIDSSPEKLDSYLTSQGFGNYEKFKGIENYKHGTDLTRFLNYIEGNWGTLYNQMAQSSIIFKFYNKFSNKINKTYIDYYSYWFTLSDSYNEIKDVYSRLMIVAMRVAYFLQGNIEKNRGGGTLDSILCHSEISDALPPINEVIEDLSHFLYGQELLEVIYGSNAISLSPYIKSLIIEALGSNVFTLESIDKPDYFMQFNSMCGIMHTSGKDFYPLFSNVVKTSKSASDNVIKVCVNEAFLSAVVFYRSKSTLAKDISDRIERLLGSLSENDWRESVNDFKKFGFAQAIALGIDVTSNAYEGFKQFVNTLPNRDSLDDSNLSRVIDYLDNCSELDVSSAFIELRNKYANGSLIMTGIAFNRIAEYLFEYGKLLEEHGCRGVFNRDVANNDISLKIILGHSELIAKLYAKEPEEFGEFLIRLKERITTDSSQVNSVIALFEKR